ncbi:MAG: hypothetical protein COV48_11815, partial [Elusimicrobia bacterium CG11_big_fil_rev_8_21_14_0_20_64_6]
MRRAYPAMACLLAFACVGPRARPSPEDSARQRAAVDTARSLRYYLKRYGLSHAAAKKITPEKATGPGGNPTTRELVRFVEHDFEAGLDAPEREALAEAARRTLSYFGRPDSPLFEPEPRSGPKESVFKDGWPQAIVEADSQDLPMADARGYAESRLGALGALAREAAATRLRLASSASAPASWPPGCRPTSARRLNFPAATNGFSARFTQCREGGYALIVDGFANRSLYLHELALLKALLASESLEVFHADEDEASTRDDLLLGPFDGKSTVPKRFDVLALGYYDELLEEFPSVAQSSGDGWRAFTVQVAATTMVAVAVEDSWYGESLGASIAHLLESGVEFKSVYFAGSAGALTYLPPYDLANPSCYLSRTGERLELRNELSGGEDSPCHISVESPLLETRRFLRRAAGIADTVDVEGFALAKAAAAKGLRLGAAYLVTDYPDPKPILKKHRLSETRASLRHQGARAYAQKLRQRLETGALAYRHPLEEALQKPLSGFSARSTQADIAALGFLDKTETALLARIGASTPPVLFRTRTGRLAFLAQDGLALSPAQVDLLKGTASRGQGLTPPGEESLYGAGDYLFAGVGQNDEETLYGPIIVHLSSAAWRRSFATRGSGANLLSRRGLDPKKPLSP